MSPIWVELKYKDGLFYDPALKFGLSRDDKKPLPEKVPVGSLTAQALNVGRLVPCDPPAEAQQEACQEREGSMDATPSDPATEEPDLGDSQGQVVADSDIGATDSEATLPEPVEKAAPAPTSKKRAKKAAQK